jgi:CheY-like chemotaxis protein
LSIAYGIVTKHGGYIQAHSELGRGSSIRFYLPRTEDVCESIPVPSPPAMRSVHGSETVLVVEDEAPVRLLVVRLLQAQGYIVLAAENGEHAIKVAEQQDGPIHLLLTDVVMPGCDGRELYRQLIARRPDLLVLYMTGYARMVVGDDGLDSGASILEKPFSAVELNEQVRSVLRVGRELA